MSRDKSSAIFILGMHRSGTSALTGALQAFGVHLGTNLMPANKSNPRGYFEDLDFVHLNNHLLNLLGRNWHEMLCVDRDRLMALTSGESFDRAVQLLKNHTEGHALAALKDPRLSLLIPFWQAACDAAGLAYSALVNVRDPRAVARSLFVREGIPAAKSGWLWLQYTLNAINDTVGHPALIVDYERLVDSPAVELRKIGAFIRTPINGHQLQHEAVELIDRSLNHASDEVASPAGFNRDHVPAIASRLYGIMREVASDRRTLSDVETEVEDIRQQFKSMTGLGATYTVKERETDSLRAAAKREADSLRAAAKREADRYNREKKELLLSLEANHQSLREVQNARDQLSGKIRLMENSLSWRLTRRLRWIADHPAGQTTLRMSRLVQAALAAPATYRLLVKHNLFDAGYYLSQNPDVVKRGMRPLLHYLLFGWREARSPHPMFNAAWYLYMNPSLSKGSEHPLIHYCKIGAKAGRLPRTHFDTSWYIEQFPESNQGRSNPLIHYVKHGLPAVRKLIRETSIFNAAFYRNKYPDISATGQDPLEHFLKFGIWEHRDPSAGFCHKFYLHEYPEVRALDLPPFLHYAWVGHEQGFEGIARDNHPAPEEIEKALEAVRQAEEKPSFSVIMPTWNRAHTITRAIDSVLRQSYQHFQLLVIDDGSIDGTAKLLRERYAGQIEQGRIQIIESKHIGVSAARNLGLKEARGNWIAYLDSDNAWREHFLLLNAHTIIGQPEIRTLYSELRVCDRTRGFAFIRRRDFSWSQLFEANYIDLNIYCHHRDVFVELGGFDEKLTRLVDWDLILRQTATHRPALIPYTLADYYLCHSYANITHREDLTDNRNIVRAKFDNKAEQFMEEESRLDSIRLFDEPDAAQRGHAIIDGYGKKATDGTGVALVHELGTQDTMALSNDVIGQRRQEQASSSSTVTAISDFHEMLRRGFLDPDIKQPFDENKKRCLAFCDVLAKSYQKTALSHPTPLITILVPVYNGQNTITRAFNSIQSQTYNNFEAIVIDDGSTDQSVPVIERFIETDKRFILLRIERNQGKSHALNEGIKQARGEWIAYLDSDNEWDKRYLAAMLGGAFRAGNPDALFSGQLLYNNGSSTPYAARVPTYNVNLLYNRNYVDHNSFIHKADIFDKVGTYDTTLKHCMDYEFALRVSKQCRMISVPLILTHYHYSTESTITSVDDNKHDVHHHHARQLAQSYLSDNHWSAQFLVRNNIKHTHRKVSVIIPSYNSQEDIKACIMSLQNTSEADRTEIIVVDNNSGNETVEYLKSLAASKAIRLILNDFNYGFTYAVNQGIDAAGAESDVVLCNNDALLTAGAITLLQHYANTRDDAGLLIPAQILFPKTKTITTHVPFANPHHYCDVTASVHHNNVLMHDVACSSEIIELSFAPFFFVLIPHKTRSLLGHLDAELGRHYRSDRLYCNAVRHILNKKIYYVPNARVYHGLQKSTDALKASKPDAYQLMFAKNMWHEEQMNKHGYSRRTWDT